MYPYTSLLFCFLLLIACDNNPKNPYKGQPTSNNTYAYGSTNLANLTTDSLPEQLLREVESYAQKGEIEYLEVPAFTIQLRPSTKVRTLLEEGKETFILSIAISGQAKDPSSLAEKEYYSAYDELIFLLDKEYPMKTFPKEITIQEKISKEAYEALKDKNYEIVVDGYSGRKSSENNLFHTDVLAGNISDFKGTQQILGVRLLK